MGPTRVVEVNSDDSLDTLRQKVSEVHNYAYASMYIAFMYMHTELHCSCPDKAECL